MPLKKQWLCADNSFGVKNLVSTGSHPHDLLALNKALR
jgi:hypothetical protein